MHPDFTRVHARVEMHRPSRRGLGVGTMDANVLNFPIALECQHGEELKKLKPSEQSGGPPLAKCDIVKRTGAGWGEDLDGRAERDLPAGLPGALRALPGHARRGRLRRRRPLLHQHRRLRLLRRVCLPIGRPAHKHVINSTHFSLIFLRNFCRGLQK